MSQFRDRLIAAAQARIAEPSAETDRALCSALELMLRSSDAPGDPSPRECDGVGLYDFGALEASVYEFQGYAWLVTSQKVTPVRARFWSEAEEMKFEIRFGIRADHLTRRLSVYAHDWGGADPGFSLSRAFGWNDVSPARERV